MSTDELSFEEYESDLGLDEEDRKAAKSGDDVDWYKGVKGVTSRASIIYFHPVDVAAVNKVRKKDNRKFTKEELVKIAQKAVQDRAAALGKTADQLTKVDKLDLSEVHFKKVVGHFGGEGIGFVLSRLGKDGPEADEVWKKLEEPKTHYTTLLLLYPTNKKGELDKNAFPSWAQDPTVMPWRFSPKRYDLIWKVNSGLVKNDATIADQDLLLECKDEKYQQIEPSADGKAFWQRSDKLKATVLAKAVRFYPKLIPFREMTTSQLREKLGLSGPDGAVTDVASGDFNEMLQNV